MGKIFQVIRDLKVDPKQIPEKAFAVFKVRFKFSGLPLFVNKRLSMMPTPFFLHGVAIVFADSIIHGGERI